MIAAKTNQDAILSPSPPIINIFKIHEEASYRILVYLISDIVEFLNLGNTMNAAQVLQTAKLIIEDPQIKNLKPDDFKVCFDNAKKGVYGKNFNRIDGQIIFEWLHSYWDERADLMEQINIKQHNTLVKNKNIIRPEVVEMYKEIIRLGKEIESSKKIPVNIRIAEEGSKYKYEADFIDRETSEKKHKKELKKSDRDLFIQQCFRDFQDLLQKKPYQASLPDPVPGTFIIPNDNPVHILYNGRPIGEIEYVELKLKEYDLNQNNKTYDTYR